MTTQTECKRCGTCCLKGGPVLHTEDLHLIRSAIISFDNLVTIRKNELAYRPDIDKVVPAENEFIKIGGKGKTWECLFYDSTNPACLIHENRPLECRLLECWNTAPVTEMIGKECLTRQDILPADDPLQKYISAHEELCPYSEINRLLDLLHSSGNRKDVIGQLSSLVTKDLALRDKAIREFNLSVNRELFYFGRPVFQVIDFNIEKYK
ncbi:MAG: YkgJ family cysteine cluster protein [Desulfobulbaceae bacterium]|uniref:YkgJ family cysteine cluster protein n=1 Tax=Candidatus Desulfobia pelagia TaxID=2841692 RepID=A0A8J6NDA3_9BACT|nr:YkgJ family cysteine cluster protein [Candidatus Desulfobia pelagia]